MSPFETFTSGAVPLEMDDVDTDMIIPAQFLTKINREGYGQHVFQRLRENDPTFVFSLEKYKKRRILLTQSNFGCGSSREHAVWALVEAGIHVIIAESYSDIFYSNAQKNGLLTIILSRDIMVRLLNQVKNDDSMTLTIDLHNQSIRSSQGDHIHFEYDAFRKTCFLKGQDDFDYLLEAVS